MSICDWKEKCVRMCGNDLWSVDNTFEANFELSYRETAFGLSGRYSCWCCDIGGSIGSDDDPFGGEDSFVDVVEDDGATDATGDDDSAAPEVNNELDLSGLPSWVWAFSFLLPVVYVVVAKLLTLGLPAAKIYAAPGGLTMLRALRCQGLSWTTLCQWQTGYLEVVEGADGTEHWKIVGWFPGLAAGHDLLGICFGDSDELSKRCRVAKMAFSVLLASALSIAFGSTQLEPSSDCTYECSMGARGTNFGEPGLSCELDTFFRDDEGEAEEPNIELPSDYLSTTGLFILLINQLYGYAIEQLLLAATRKGRASDSGGVVISLMVAVVLATGTAAVVAAYSYLQDVGSCPGEDEDAVLMSVTDTAHMSREEFADNFLYGCGASSSSSSSNGTGTGTVYTDPCTASCHPVAPKQKVRVCVLGAVVGLALDWFAFKPLVQGTGLFFLAKLTTKLDSFHMKPALEEGSKAKAVQLSATADVAVAKPPVAQPFSAVAQQAAVAQPVATPVAQAMPMAQPPEAPIHMV